MIASCDRSLTELHTLGVCTPTTTVDMASHIMIMVHVHSCYLLLLQPSFFLFSSSPFFLSLPHTTIHWSVMCPEHTHTHNNTLVSHVPRMLAVAISNPKSHYCPLTVILSCSSCSALRLRSSSIRPASKLFFLLSSNVLPVSSEEVVLCLLAQSAGSITLDLFSSCVSDGGGMGYFQD